MPRVEELPPIDLPAPLQQAAPSEKPPYKAGAEATAWLMWPEWTGPSVDWNAFSRDWPGIPGLGPGSTHYAFAEMVAFQRDNQAQNVPLVTDTITNDTVLSVGDLDVPMAYGVRAFVGARGCGSWGWEAGYLGIYGMGTSQMLSGPENLQLAGPLAGQVFPFAAAEHVDATYTSTFHSGEINIFKSCCQSGRCGRTGCESDPCGDTCGGCCIDWLGGFRYVNLTEQAGLTFTCCTTQPSGPYIASYDVQTTNNLFGGQFGGRASRTWSHWAVEGWAKAGVFANVQHQAQGPVIDPIDPSGPRSDRRYGSGVDPAMLADLNLSVVYRISDVFGLRVGYNALWVGNISLAPEQWNFNTSPADAGSGLVSHGGLFLNGVNVGVDACW